MNTDNLNTESANGEQRLLSSVPQREVFRYSLKEWVLNSCRLVIIAFAVLFTLARTEGIHLVLLVAVAGAFYIGYVAPVKGWIWAVILAILLVTGFVFFVPVPPNQAAYESNLIKITGACLLTFIGSFMAAFIRKP